MRKDFLIWMVAGLVLITVGIWLINSGTSGEAGFFLLPVVVLIVVGFAVFVGIRRYRSYRINEPQEDEYSIRLMTRATSVAFYLSLYWWLVVMYFSDQLQLEAHSIIGGGILGMALLFVSSWLYFRIKGIDHA
ncbi:MAG: hypothetical protein KDC57_00120 [Saprospiraceae bacterium]|nr:hypothetical protein [Saprospiraceae bacterium]